MKQKYTVIYSEIFSRGSQRHCIPRYKYIECEEKSLIDTINTDPDIADMTFVSFIFKGWCQHENE